MSRSDTTATPYVMPLIDVLDLLDTTRGDDAPPLRLRVKPDRRRAQTDWPREKERRASRLQPEGVGVPPAMGAPDGAPDAHRTEVSGRRYAGTASSAG